MKFTKSDLKTICVALRLVQTALPDPDEAEELLDMCQSVMDVDDLHEIDVDLDEVIAGTRIKDLARRLINE